MINVRDKGKAGEREIATILRNELGVPATRNLREQAAVGGSDIIGVPGWAIEVKRQKKYLRSWWTQAAEQAASAGLEPVLLYRLDRKPWMARCCMCSINPAYGHFQIEMDLMDWITVAREHIVSADLWHANDSRLSHDKSKRHTENV